MADIHIAPAFEKLSAGTTGEIAITNRANDTQRIKLGLAEPVDGLIIKWDRHNIELESDQRRVVELTVRRRQPFAYALGGEVKVPLLARGDDSGSVVAEITVQLRPLYELLSLRWLLAAGGLLAGVLITTFVYYAFLALPPSPAPTPTVIAQLPTNTFASAITATPFPTFAATPTATITLTASPSSTPVFTATPTCTTPECQCNAVGVWFKLRRYDSWGHLYQSRTPRSDSRILRALEYNGKTFDDVLHPGDMICLVGLTTSDIPDPIPPTPTFTPIPPPSALSVSCSNQFTGPNVITIYLKATANMTTEFYWDVLFTVAGNQEFRQATGSSIQFVFPFAGDVLVNATVVAKGPGGDATYNVTFELFLNC